MKKAGCVQVLQDSDWLFDIVEDLAEMADDGHDEAAGEALTVRRDHQDADVLLTGCLGMPRTLCTLRSLPSPPLSDPIAEQFACPPVLPHVGLYQARPVTMRDRLRVGWLNGRGAARAEDAQGTPTQSHMSPSLL